MPSTSGGFLTHGAVQARADRGVLRGGRRPPTGQDRGSLAASASPFQLPVGVETAMLFGVFLLLLALRRIDTLTQAEFRNEDGQVYFVGSYFGGLLEQLGRSYAGYLELVPRLVAWLERIVDVTLAPLVANGISLVIVAGLATWIASDRLATVLPSRSSRLLLASLLVLLPGSWETLGSITLIQFYFAIFLALTTLLDEPQSKTGRAVELSVIVLAGLTGPFSLLFAPLVFINAVQRRSRWSIIVAFAICVCAVVQAIALLLGSRTPVIPTAEGAAGLLLARTWSAVIGDFWLAGAVQVGAPLPLVGIATGALIAAMAAASTRIGSALRATILYVAAVCVAGALAGEPASFPESTYLASRYFLLPTFLVALVIAGGAGASGSRASDSAWIVLSGLFVFGIVGDFSLPRHETHDWALRSQCIGGPAPCDVPVEYPNAWTIHWPGSRGPYVQPQPHHAEAAQP